MREIDYGNLVEQAKKNNEQAITKLYEATYKNAYFTSYQILKDKHEAEDVLQECYIKAFQKLDMLKKAESFPSWINRIVSNRSIDVYRKKKPLNFSQLTSKEEEDGKEIDFEDDKESYRPEIVADKKETARLLGEIIETLSDEQRIVVTMFYFQGMTVKEIAKDLETSENTIKSRLNYGRKKIEQEVLMLEKKGTKLYGLAPIPFLLLLMETNAEAASVSSAVIGGVLAGTASTASTAGTVGAGATGVAGGATTAAKAAGGAVVKKILVGALIAGVTIGGGTFAYTKLKPENTTATKQEEKIKDKKEVKADKSNYKIQDYTKIVEGKDGRPDTIELNIDSPEAKKINKELNEKINRYYDNSEKTTDINAVPQEKIQLVQMDLDSMIESELLQYGYVGYSNNLKFQVIQNRAYDEIMVIYVDLLSTVNGQEGFQDNKATERLVFNIDKKTGEFLNLEDFLKREGKTIDNRYDGTHGELPYEYNYQRNHWVLFSEDTELELNSEYKLKGKEMVELFPFNDFGNKGISYRIYPQIENVSMVGSSGEIATPIFLSSTQEYDNKEFISDENGINVEVKPMGDPGKMTYLGSISIDDKKYQSHMIVMGNSEEYYYEDLDIPLPKELKNDNRFSYGIENKINGEIMDEEGNIVGDITLIQYHKIENLGVEDRYTEIYDKIRANVKLNSGESFNNIELKLK